MSNRFKTVSTFSLLALLATAVWSGYSHFSVPAAESSPPSGKLSATTGGVQVSLSSSQPALTSSGNDTAGYKTLAQLKAELSSLREQLQSHKQKRTQQAQEIERLSSLLANSDAQYGISCDDEFDDIELTVEELEQEEALEAQRAVLFERTLAAEPIDDEESDRLKSQVAEMLEAEDLSDSTLADVACGERLCRIELQHRDDDALNAFIDLSPMLLEMSGESFTEMIEYEDGSIGAVLYIARDGFSLPETET